MSDHGNGLTVTSGRTTSNPRLPCHNCGRKERFMEMKRSEDWTLQYLDDGGGQWVAFCEECDPDE